MPPRIDAVQPQPVQPPVQFTAPERRAPAATPEPAPRFETRAARAVAAARGAAVDRAGAPAPGPAPVPARPLTVGPNRAVLGGVGPAAAALTARQPVATAAALGAAGAAAPGPAAPAAAGPAAATFAQRGGPAVIPIEQRLPERVVEMLNAQRGREAVTLIARAGQRAGDVALAPPQQAGMAPGNQAPAAGVAEPRVVVEPGAPAVNFAPATPRAAIAQAGAVNADMRRADALQAFRAQVQANAAPQPMGTPARPRTVIDQRV